MAKRPKKPPKMKKMKGTIQDIPNSLENGYHGTVGFLDDLRKVKGKSYPRASAGPSRISSRQRTGVRSVPLQRFA